MSLPKKQEEGLYRNILFTSDTHQKTRGCKIELIFFEKSQPVQPFRLQIHKSLAPQTTTKKIIFWLSFNGSASVQCPLTTGPVKI